MAPPRKRSTAVATATTRVTRSRLAPPPPTEATSTALPTGSRSKRSPPAPAAPRAAKKPRAKSASRAGSVPDGPAAAGTAAELMAAAAATTQQPASALMPPSASEFLATLPPPRRDDFDLQAYLAGTANHEPRNAAPDSILAANASLREELRSDLRNEIIAMYPPAALQLQHQTPPQPAVISSAQGVGFGGLVATQPNRHGILPPACLQTLTSAAFPPWSKQPRQIYNPHPVDRLAAARQFPVLDTPQGKLLTPTGFVYSIQTDPAVEFAKFKSVVSSVFSACVGDPGASILHFDPVPRKMDQLPVRSSGDGHDDYAAKHLPRLQKIETAGQRPLSYDDILNGIHGLSTFTSRYSYDYIQRLMERARVFVASNKANDTFERSSRVVLTLNAVNLFLARAFQCLRDDSPAWWSNFSDAAEKIDYNSIEWLMMLATHSHNSAQQLQVPQQQHAPSAGRAPRPALRPAAPRRQPESFPRLPGFPEHIKKLVPKKGTTEPCLKFFSGHGCAVAGKSCGYGKRLHHWDEALDDELLKFIKNYFDPNRQTDN